jgi:hypothetical protein
LDEDICALPGQQKRKFQKRDQRENFIQISLHDFRHNLHVGTERESSFFGSSAADRFMNSSMASRS